MLNVMLAVQTVKPKLLTESGSGGHGSIQDQDLEDALRESRRLMDKEDESLHKALAMSMEGLCYSTSDLILQKFLVQKSYQV